MTWGGKTGLLITKLGLIALVVFALYSNVRLISRNNQLRQRLAETEQRLEENLQRNRKLELLIAYYQTPSYQDAEARKRLGLRLPDETVLRVSGLETKSDKSLEDPFYENTEPTPAQPPSNFSQWLNYFFN